MPRVNPELLVWARETGGLTLEEAAHKLDVKETSLTSYEAGSAVPSRPLLLRMSKQYRRPLVAFYMTAPPRRGDRGEDFRSVPEQQSDSAAMVDALVRDIRARQTMVRSLLEDEDEADALPFVGSASMEDGVGTVLASMRQTIGLDLTEFRAQASPEGAFALLRNRVEAVGVFVLLIGNLGSHHSAIDVEAFRGFALADPVAPFIVINDQDAKAAWSFTLLHELAHIWLGASGVSGTSSSVSIERFCNDVASAFLLPPQELSLLQFGSGDDLDAMVQAISDFARERHLSRPLVAYRLLRATTITEPTWKVIGEQFRKQWLEGRERQREAARSREKGGPNFYVVRRHRLGTALLRLVSRTLSEGILTPTKAGKVLGVRPRNVGPLLSGAALSSGQAA